MKRLVVKQGEGDMFSSVEKKRPGRNIKEEERQRDGSERKG